MFFFIIFFRPQTNFEKYPSPAYGDVQKEETELKKIELRAKINILNINKVNSLWHITHRDNIQNIVKDGVLSHEGANKIKYFDISNPGVQDRRLEKEPIHGRKIHEYAPLFINPKNAMLYSRKDIRDELCLVEVSLDVLESEYLYTDGNASRRDTNFYDQDDLFFENINWNNVFHYYITVFIISFKNIGRQFCIYNNFFTLYYFCCYFRCR